jgi:hypothetical protein
MSKKGWEMTQERRRKLNDFCLSHDKCLDLGCPIYWFANQAGYGSACYNCDFESEFYKPVDIRKAYELLELYKIMIPDKNNHQ